MFESSLLTRTHRVYTKYQASMSKSSVVVFAGQLVRDQGPRVLFQGWTSFFGRVAPLFAFNMPLYEGVRTLMGIGYMD